MKFIYGTESYLIEKELQKDTKKDGVEPIFFSNNENIEDIILDLSTASMFFDNKLIIIKNHPVLESKEQNEELISVIEQGVNNVIFVLENDKPNTKLPLINFLMEKATVVECKAFNTRNIISFIKETVTQKGGSIENIAAIELANRLPEDLGIIVNEIEKLLMESDSITIAMIQKSIGEYLKDDYFALSNEIVSLNRHGIISAYQKRKNAGEEPTVIIAQISSTLTLALNVSMYKRQGMALSDIADKLKIHIFRIKKSNELLNNLKNISIEELIKQLAELDKNIKTGFVDGTQGLENFLINLIK